MPEAAWAAAEAQFRRLIAPVDGSRSVDLSLYFIEEVPRSPAARDRMSRTYAPLSDLEGRPLDALIVTGAEPRASRLEDEPFFPALADLADWSETHTVSTLWSCLAAHAAVRRFDGVRRRPLRRKCSGVFPLHATGSHALLAGFEGPLKSPHSRLNGVAARDLVAHGYEVLTRCSGGGVDLFVRDGACLQVFVQGHPEYDAETLMLEHRRDARRHLKGELAAPPRLPRGYYPPIVEARLRTAARRGPAALVEAMESPEVRAPDGDWLAWSGRLYRNWLGLIAARTQARRPASA
jgi:homoserine O-succinyltransferase